jgi:Sulfotransferase family
VLSHGEFVKFSPHLPIPREVVEQYRFISGHFGYVNIAPYLADAYSFTFLRDPVRRILSFYRFCLSPEMQKNFAVARLAKELGRDAFLLSTLPEVCEILDNQQTWQLARMYWKEDREALKDIKGQELLALAIQHLDEFSYVGLTETFSSDFRNILDELGVDSSLDIPWEFETRKPIGEHQLKKPVLDRLRERMSLDYELYEYVRSRRS